MPKNVRNAWVNAAIQDDQNEDIRTFSFGPNTKYGSLSLNVHVRNNGQVETGCTVQTFCKDDAFVLVVTDDQGNEIFRKETVR